MKQIPKFKLIPELADEEAKALPKFRWARPEIGTRHQLGGKPDFIQKTEWPKCKKCGAEMTFYGQLDSINDEICLADAGMVYVFVCFRDFYSESFILSN